MSLHRGASAAAVELILNPAAIRLHAAGVADGARPAIDHAAVQTRRDLGIGQRRGIVEHVGGSFQGVTRHASLLGRTLTKVRLAMAPPPPRRPDRAWWPPLEPVHDRL